MTIKKIRTLMNDKPVLNLFSRYVFALSHGMIKNSISTKRGQFRGSRGFKETPPYNCLRCRLRVCRPAAGGIFFPAPPDDLGTAATSRTWMR